MSIRVMTWVWEHAEVAGTDLLLLLAIADAADNQGRNAWPSVADLSRKTRLDERTVQRRLKRLHGQGHITIEPGADGAETGTPSPWPPRRQHRRRHLHRINPMRRPTAGQRLLPLVEVRCRDQAAVPTLSTGRRGAGVATAPRRRKVMSTMVPARSCRAPGAISRGATGTPGSGLRRPCPNCRTG